MSKTTVFITLFACIAIVCMAADFVICGKCGHESDDGSRFCSHCGNRLAEGADVRSVDDGGDSDEDSDENEREEEKAAEVDVELIEKEIELVKTRLKKKEACEALMFCENTMALNSLAKADVGRSKRILALHKQCEKAVLSESKSTRQLRHRYGRATKEYTLQRQGLNWIPVGQAWIPSELDGQLDYRKIATLKRTTGGRCQSCLGLGRDVCSPCGGRGRIKCPGEGCKDGRVKREPQDGLSAGKKSSSSQSPLTLLVKCTGCSGTAIASCSSCGGNGKKICEKCEGSGERPRCERCDGEGVRTCRKCKGSGTYKDDPCKSCRGGGVILCTSCHGDGRDR